MKSSTTMTLRHGKVELALHELRAGTGRPLLLLHGLGERSPEKVPADVEAWDGPVYALAASPDGSIWAGGAFTSFPGRQRSGLAKFVP